MEIKEKCRVALGLEEAGFEHHAVIEGCNVWKNKNLYAVFQIGGEERGIQFLYSATQYSPEICREDILKKLRGV